MSTEQVPSSLSLSGKSRIGMTNEEMEHIELNVRILFIFGYHCADRSFWGRTTSITFVSRRLCTRLAATFATILSFLRIGTLQLDFNSAIGIHCHVSRSTCSSQDLISERSVPNPWFHSQWDGSSAVRVVGVELKDCASNNPDPPVNSTRALKILQSMTNVGKRFKLILFQSFGLICWYLIGLRIW
jgi:hypothetical protein